MLRKLPIVGVFGQGTPLAPERERLAREIGAAVARLGAHLLTGGGYGVMAAASEGFTQVPGRAGFCIGIVPRRADGALDEPNRDLEGRPYPNPHVEIAIFTPLQSFADNWRDKPARNHINVLSCDAVVALPGNTGTRNELDMAAFYRGEAARARHERHTVLLGPAAEFTPEHRELFVHAATLADAEAHIRRILNARGFPLPAGDCDVRARA